MNGYKKKIVAIVVACIVVAAAVGVPIAFGDGAAIEVEVKAIPPVVESITISTDDDIVDMGSKTVTITITALVYCANGVDGIGTVSVTIDPPITGVTEPITMTMQAGDPGLHKKNYKATFELPPGQAADVYTVTVTVAQKMAGVAPSDPKAVNFTVTPLMAMSTTNGDLIRYNYEIKVRVFYAGKETEEKEVSFEVPKKEAVENGGRVENGGSSEGEKKGRIFEGAFALIAVILVILVLFFIIVRKRRKK